MDAIPGPVYISGPMSGRPSLNIDAFRAARAIFTALHPTLPPIVPHDLTPPRRDGESDISHYERAMRVDFAAIDICSTIALLPGWEKSSGSRRELQRALDRGLKVVVLGADGRPQ